MGISEAAGKVGPPGPKAVEPGETPGKTPGKTPGEGRCGRRCGQLAAVPPVPGGEDPPDLPADLEACLSTQGMEHQRLAPVTVRSLKSRPALSRLLEAVATGGPSGLARALQAGGDRSPLLDPLLMLALTRMVIPDLELEGLFTALRRLALEALVPEDGPQAAVAGPHESRKSHEFADSPESLGFPEPPDSADFPGPTESPKSPDSPDSPDSPESPEPPLLPPLRFLAALAYQCFLTGYVYSLSDREESLARSMETLLVNRAMAGPAGGPAGGSAGGPEVAPGIGTNEGGRKEPEGKLGREAPEPAGLHAARVAVLACYIPIFRWERAPEVVEWTGASDHPDLAALIRQQLTEPLEEERLRGEVPKRGEIRGRVSEEVRVHYEENPYPRWTSVDRNEPRSPAAVLGDLFPESVPPGLERMDPPRILVAGCGTGQHLLQLHYRFRGARIHGLDLSRSGLAFAERRIREHGAEGITLEQADILSLTGWEERFDIVESVGVLQHLEDPVRGWRILRDLLRPGGLMKIGIYSRLARRQVRAARKYLQERGFGSSEEEVRRARSELAKRHSGSHEGGFLSIKDFYSMQECRDLLFHAHELTFTLPRVEEILRSLKLDFLGFELPDPEIRRSFLSAHPQEGAERDLAAWHHFERRNPSTFAKLYQLWLQAV